VGTLPDGTPSYGDYGQYGPPLRWYGFAIDLSALLHWISVTHASGSCWVLRCFSAAAAVTPRYHTATAALVRVELPAALVPSFLRVVLRVVSA